MKRFGIAVACIAIAATSALVGGASIASAEESEVIPGVTPGVSPLVGCTANFICIYTSANYENPFVAIECAVSGTFGLGINRHSATNRCGNKTDWLRENGSVVACMNPGGDRPNPGGFNEVFVAAEFGAFC